MKYSNVPNRAATIAPQAPRIEPQASRNRAGRRRLLAPLAAPLTAALLALAGAQAAHAAVYYVDAARGNDRWSGRAADPTASAADGPWQSLGRASRAALAPGDVVALRCGSSWNETLKLSASGTASAPITVQSYPTTCSNGAPSIDGFVHVQDGQWTRQAANLYRLQLPVNLVRDRGFDAGLGNWRIWSPDGIGRLSVQSGCAADGSACMQASAGGGTSPTVIYGATFSVAVGQNYRAAFSFKAPAGVRLRAYVRRAVAPYDVVGLQQTLTGNGAWQSVSYTFTGSAQLDNARLDFDLAPGAGTIALHGVKVEQQLKAPPFAAVLGTTPLVIAHHPNRGYNPSEPSSPYLRAATDADAIATAPGATGSSFLPLGSDYKLPANAQMQVGTKVLIRTKAWLIDERKVAGVAAGRLQLDRPTSYPLKEGWGFYFTGAAWMLDEAGEWLYNAADNSVQLRTASDLPPMQSLNLASLDTCIDLSTLQHVRIDGLQLAGCRVGVNAEGTTGIVMQRLQIRDIGSHGVYAPASQGAQLLGSTIVRAGQHAVLGADENFARLAYGMVLRDNSVIDAGATRIAGKVVTLPTTTAGALHGGSGARIENNVLSGAGYHGVRSWGSSIVQGNLIESTCLMLDDCGGIYQFGSSVAGTRIEANHVRNIDGGADGKPAGSTSQSQGIFLDDGVTGVTVVRNTVVNAESGVLLHNARANTVQANLLYGNRKHQIWLFEDTTTADPNGDLHGNVIVDNQLFPTRPNTAVGQQSTVKNTVRFATYDRNRYSALMSDRVVSEDWPTGGGSLQFPLWQRATAPGGQARNAEPNGSVVNAPGYAKLRVIGPNMIANASLSSGTALWTPWNQTAPLASLQVADCGGQRCLDVIAGGSTTLVATPPFSTVEGNWYRVAFDVAAPAGATPLSALVRRGGGGSNGFESLMGSAELITAQPTFQRFSFAFKATKTVNAADSITKDIGARLYFDRIAPGSRVYLANVELVPITAADAAVQTHLLSNPTAASSSAACPDAGSNPAHCAQYFEFGSGSAVQWPLALPARSSTVVYSRDTSLVDSDGDGIPDQQDACPGTPAGKTVNAQGCSLS